MINIALADKHRIVRLGLIRYIESLGEFCVSIEAESEQDILKKIADGSAPYDICIFGTPSESFNGYDTLRKLKALDSTIKVLIFTGSLSPIALMLMMNYGAYGYISRNCEPEYMKAALIEVYEGGKVYQSDIRHGLEQLYRKTKRKNITNLFSTKEYQVMALCRQHLCAKQIASAMNVDKRTVDTYFARIYTKLSIRTQEELLQVLYETGIS